MVILFPLKEKEDNVMIMTIRSPLLEKNESDHDHTEASLEKKELVAIAISFPLQKRRRE